MGHGASVRASRLEAVFQVDRKSFAPVFLSEVRGSLRPGDESKDPEDVSSAMLRRGVLPMIPPALKDDC